jgi:hypothetical protein
MAGLAIGKPFDWFLAIGRAAKIPRRVIGGTIRDVKFFDVRFDGFWEQLAKVQAILVVRDSCYLNWRYAAYPFAGIQSFELSRGDKLLGFAVIHLAIDEDQLRFVAILELAGQQHESGVLGHLLGEAIRRASRAEAHYVIARAPTPDCEDSFRKMGFKVRRMDYSPVTYKNNSDVPTNCSPRT